MTTTDFRDGALGAFIGLAVGDALGAPIEFSRRDSLPEITGYRAGGPFNLEAGQWTDDTSCALALAESVLRNGWVSRGGLLQQLQRWYRQGTFSVNGRCFDIGNQTRKAIEHFERTGEPLPTDEGALGNGGLMRLAPVLLISLNGDECALLACAQSAATHPSREATQYAKMLGTVLWEEAIGNPFKDRKIQRRKRKQVYSSGHVRHTFEAAQWCVSNTSSFEEAVLLAANLGDDSDTVAAVTGQWAGARYGLSGIPEPLIQGLWDHQQLLGVAERLWGLRR